MEVGVAMPRLNNRDNEEQRRINELYGLLKEEGTKDCLEDMEKRTTCHTPLHEAAAVGMSHLALEVANLKPSLARKLNHDGLSPMHLALRNGHVQMVRALMAFDSGLIRVKGRDLVTPLHYAAELGQTELLAEFLLACPSSIEDLTSRCETAMHVTVRNKRPDACEVLLRWMIRNNLAGILRWEDEDGNTALHIAALTNQPQVMKLLIRYVKVNMKNFAGLTALDLCYVEGHQLDLNAEVRKILCDVKAKRASDVSDSLTCAGYLCRAGLSLMECWDQRLGITDAKSRAKIKVEFLSMTLVVAVLIATATYQGVLSPPGGYWQDDSPTAATSAAASGSHGPSPAVAAAAAAGPGPHTAGRMIMSGQSRTAFLVYNSGAFVFSVIVIIMITSLFEEFAIMLFLPVAFVMATYILALYQATTDKKARTHSALVVVAGFVVVVLACIICYLQTLHRGKVRLDVPGRRVSGSI